MADSFEWLDELLPADRAQEVHAAIGILQEEAAREAESAKKYAGLVDHLENEISDLVQELGRVRGQLVPVVDRELEDYPGQADRDLTPTSFRHPTVPEGDWSRAGDDLIVEPKLPDETVAKGTDPDDHLSARLSFTHGRIVIRVGRTTQIDQIVLEPMR